MMATALAALVMLSGCGSAPAASSEVETYSSAMQLVTLTDDEMLASIQEAAKELQKNINKTDETAKVDVEVDKDGKCIVYASGRDENGNATTRQELCKADTIKDMPPVLSPDFSFRISIPAMKSLGCRYGLIEEIRGISGSPRQATIMGAVQGTLQVTGFLL